MDTDDERGAEGRTDTPRGIRSRRALAIGLVAGVLAVGLAAVALEFGPGRADAGAHLADRPSRTASFVDPGVSPPATTSSGAPGTEVTGGADQSDPFLTAADGRYLLFTSGGTGPAPLNVPVATSRDFVHWTPPTEALPVLPTWAHAGYTWAPDMHRFGSHYALYFTAKVAGRTPATQCIGSAFSTSPTGPYVAGPTPFICQLHQGGSIDPRVFVDANGTPWMVWKSDQNIGGASTPTKMWSQRLSRDGTALLGRPSFLLSPDEPWQGTVVEAPDMVEVDGDYWVFYSANWFNQPAYAIGAARCQGPAGPCRDTSTTPLLSSNLQGQGPGEESVFHDGAGYWMLYSPWRSLAPHPDIPPRPVFITRIGFHPSGPYLAAGAPPSSSDRLSPSVGSPAP